MVTYDYRVNTRQEGDRTFFLNWDVYVEGPSAEAWAEADKIVKSRLLVTGDGFYFTGCELRGAALVAAEGDGLIVLWLSATMRWESPPADPKPESETP